MTSGNFWSVVSTSTIKSVHCLESKCIKHTHVFRTQIFAGEFKSVHYGGRLHSWEVSVNRGLIVHNDWSSLSWPSDSEWRDGLVRGFTRIGGACHGIPWHKNDTITNDTTAAAAVKRQKSPRSSWIRDTSAW